MNVNYLKSWPIRIKLVILVAFMIVGAPLLAAQSLRPLSPQAKISLITMWPGSEIHIAFGHSAFRVQDPEQNIDYLFNYGAFNFSDPWFVARFVEGDLNYTLEVSDFKAYYRYFQNNATRRWDEQSLDFSPEQRQGIFDFLVNNAQEANKYYRYDFIMDNCSTRPRDVLEKVLGTEIKFDDSALKTPGYSYRQMIDIFVADRPLYQLAFYITMGTRADQVVSPRNAMFLPQYLLAAFDSATIVSNGVARPLVSKKVTILEPTGVVDNSMNTGHPLWLFPPLALLALLSLIRLFRRQQKQVPCKWPWWSKAADFLLFFVLGIFGVLVAYLDYFSLHSATKGNLNIFWLFPVHLIVAFFIIVPLKPRWLRIYWAIFAVQPIAILALWALWPQALHPYMIAPMLLAATRAAALCLRWQPYKLNSQSSLRKQSSHSHPS